jgi:hypothetical protein
MRETFAAAPADVGRRIRPIERGVPTVVVV